MALDSIGDVEQLADNHTMTNPNETAVSITRLLDALKDKNTRRLLGYVVVLNSVLVVLTAFLADLENPFPIIFGVLLFALLHLFAHNNSQGHRVFTYALASIFFALALLYVGQVIKTYFNEVYIAIVNNFLPNSRSEANFSQRHFGTADFYNKIKTEYDIKLAPVGHQAQEMNCGHVIRFYYIKKNYQASMTIFMGITPVSSESPKIVPVVSEDLEQFIKQHQLLQWNQSGNPYLRVMKNSGTAIQLNPESISAGWLHHYNDPIDPGEYSWFLIPLDGCEGNTNVDVYVVADSSEMAGWHPDRHLWEIQTGTNALASSLQFTSSTFSQVDKPCNTNINAPLHDALAKFYKSKPTDPVSNQVLKDLSEVYDFNASCFRENLVKLYNLNHMATRSDQWKTLVLTFGTK